jgi:hypothetical protein
MKVARLSALRTDRLYHSSYESTPVNPSGMEPATLWLVAQCLKQLRHRVPPNHVQTLNKSGCVPDSNQQYVSRFKEQTRTIKYGHNYGFTQLKEYTAKTISKHISAGRDHHKNTVDLAGSWLNDSVVEMFTSTQLVS